VKATVTDAHVALGRVPPTLLDGDMRLDVQMARAAIERHVAGPLGISIEDAAEGVIRIINANMTGALKVVSVERGYDPKNFAMVAFGGAGPLHGVELGRALACRAVLVPRYPGLLCALGLLATDLQYDYARTALQRGPEHDLAAINAVWSDLEQEADSELAREGIPAERRRFVRLADLRYAKQGFELTLEAPGGRLGAADAARLMEAFHAQHERLYTFAERDTQVEIVTLRLRAMGVVEKIALPEIPVAAGSMPEPYERRSIRLDGASHRDVPAYRRDALRAGHRINGFSVVDQLDSTSLILPGQTAEVDRHGNLIIQLS
jgi:N-methylhydantoinase A